MRFLAVAALIILGGCTFVGPGIYHTVSSGESFWSIAEAYGLDSDKLAEANRRLEDFGRLYPGDRVYIPGARYTVNVSEKVRRFVWPLKGEVIRGFGREGTQRSLGILIRAPEGSPVNAAEAGRVVFASEDFRIYGKTLILDHGDDYNTVYAHNSRVLVREGDPVAKGMKVAESGSSGRVVEPALYFEVRYREEARNPLHFLP
ncbi:MAG: peptidoglycan DD-metalloendopeptidase family protein [Elusimicrobia bacterium]|nr:peptidoglycan DD-metalloendopeptidase family protein [Elusimicrobiota bacterium]